MVETRRTRQTRLDFSKAKPKQTSPAANRTRGKVAQTRSASCKKPSHVELSSSEPDSDEQVPSVHTPVRTTRRAQRKSKNRAKEKIAVITDTTETSDEEVSSFDEPVRNPRRAKEKIAAIIDTTETEDEEIQAPTSRNRRKRGRDQISSDEDESDGSNSDVPILKSSNKKKVKTQEAEDLEEDLEFLRSSPPSILRSQQPNSKAEERRKALEQLKTLRTKDAPLVSKNKKKTVVMDSDDEDDEIMPGSKGVHRAGSLDSIVDHVESEEESECYEYDGPTARDVFEEDEEDDDFIVDDDEDAPIGAPTEVDIPIQLSRWATAKPKQLFKFAVEWFVQKKLNPAFDKDKEIYQLTWRKLNDEIMGLVGSKYSSAAWNRDFTYSLQARPLLQSHETPHEFKSCEACNRTGHVARFEMQFTGNPYDPRTYEDVEQDTDEEDEGITRDSKGQKLPSEERVYALGSHCYKNAYVAHTLKHWRYSLMEWVLDYLEKHEYLTPEMIVERDGWNNAKRKRAVFDLVNKMEDEGEIDSLYRGFRAEVNSARDIKNEFGSTRW